MEEKKYLKWYNKIGYGSGDIAGNVVYAFLSSFLMIFLTDSVGLNSGIVGTLMMASKLFDGVTDIFFGSMIDKTKSKMGKARPWMLWAYLGNTIMLIAIFIIPEDMGDMAKYAYFFITYTLLNAVFYTANNIAYSSLTALITKNNNERVQMGSIRFMFAFATSLIIQSITVNAVEFLGGGAVGWKNVAIIYAVIGLIVNTILQGDLNALIAECSEYTFLTKHKRIDGTMYSCLSLGVKIGSGIGTAACGWLLSAGNYVASSAVQPQSCINMLYFMYLWVPMIINLIIAFLLSRLKVEQANRNIQAENDKIN